MSMEILPVLLLVEWGDILNSGEGAGETWLTGDWIGRPDGETEEPTMQKSFSNQNSLYLPV